MGRPPKNPVEKLQVKVLMSAIQVEKYDLKNGYQLEKYFNPDKVNYDGGVTKRSGKWDHYIKSGTKPSDEVLDEIKEKFPWAYSFYTTNLWKALRSGKQSSAYWSEFYLSVKPKIQRLCHRYKSYLAGDFFKEKSKKSAVLDKLIRIGTLESHACLIALLRESIANDNPFEYDRIETAVFNSIFWTIGQSPFYFHLNEIFDYLIEHIFVSDSTNSRWRPSPWLLSKSDLTTRISINNKNILLAEDLCLISTMKDTREFIFWKLKGNSHLIVKEMAEAFRTEKNQYQLPDSKHGLKWLIKKLNKSKAEEDQLCLEYI